MKVRVGNKIPKRNPRIIYEDNMDYITSSALFAQVSKTTIPANYTVTDRAFIFDSIPVCASKTTGQLRRYCACLAYLRDKIIGYTYYQGHKYSIAQVISLRKGNCCDLSRVVDSVADLASNTNQGDRITTRRYAIGTIIYNNTEYTHVWNQLRINNKWYDLDASNYLLSGSSSMFGKLKTGTSITYVYPPNNPC